MNRHPDVRTNGTVSTKRLLGKDSIDIMVDQSPLKACFPAKTPHLQKMTPSERTAMQQLCNYTDMNLEMILDALLHEGHIDKTFHAYTVQYLKDGRSSQSLNKFMVDLCSNVCTFESLIHVLYRTGHRDIVDILMLYLQSIITESKAHMIYPASVEYGHLKQTRKYFRALKSSIHNTWISRLQMHRLAIQLKTRLESETCENKRQRLADRYSAFLNAEIDAYATTFQEQSEDRDPLEDLKSILPRTSNTLVTEMEYYGRQAHRSAILGRFEDAEDYMKRAKSVSMFIGPCQEKVNMVFLDVLVKLREFENDPTENLRHQIMETGKYGLSLLEKEDEETICLWKRFFAIRMTYCALGMGFRANIIDGSIVTLCNLHEAELLLKQVDTENIELKHEMIFLAARARFNDLSGFLMEACHDINEAESIAERGNFKEINFIREHRQLIEKKTQCVDKGNDTGWILSDVI